MLTHFTDHFLNLLFIIIYVFSHSSLLSINYSS